MCKIVMHSCDEMEGVTVFFFLPCTSQISVRVMDYQTNKQKKSRLRTRSVGVFKQLFEKCITREKYAIYWAMAILFKDFKVK